MRRQQVKNYLVVLVLSSLLLTIVSCSKPETGKMPLTTSSKEALELYLTGRTLSDNLQNEESRQHFEKAVELDPDFAVAHLSLSLVQPSFKAFFESLAKAKSLTAKVSEAETQWILGVEAGVNGFPANQKEYFEKMIELCPNDERAHNIMAGYYFGRQDYEQAIIEYSKAIEINPDFAQPYNQLGYAYRFLDRFDEAKDVFQKYIELIPDDPNPYDSYAELLMKMGDYDESIAQYSKALEQNPRFVPSYIGIATNLNYKGEHIAARQKLLELYENGRNIGEKRQALFSMAVSYVDEGNLRKAIYALDDEYKLGEEINDPSFMSLDLNNIANILLEMGRLDEAADKFVESVKILADSDLSKDVKDNITRGHLYDMSRVACFRGDYVTADSLAKAFHDEAKALKNVNLIRQSHQLFGIIFLQKKEYDTAIKQLGLSNLLNPYNLYRMARAYDGKGDTARAKEYFLMTANFNALNNMFYSFVRAKARVMADERDS